MQNEMWAVLELMGHVRIAGRVTEEERFGCKVGRIDVPQPDGSFVTQFFTGSSIYRLTAVSEETARAVALHNKVEPIHAWEMAPPRAITNAASQDVNLKDYDDDDNPY